MKMKKGEIIAAYKDRPNAKRIQEIANDNNVTANEIRKILHDAGEAVAVFGPGRPKKEQTVSSAEHTLQKIDEILSDNEKDLEIKEESTPFQLPDCEVPKVVIALCNERITSINHQIQVYVEQVDLLNNERNELLEFIANKGEKNEKNGVHGEV